MSIFLYFFSLIENLPSDRAFHVSSEFDLSVRSREKEISVELSLGALSSGRGAGAAGAARGAALGGYQATRQRCGTGARPMGKMNKSVDKGFNKMGAVTMA